MKVYEAVVYGYQIQIQTPFTNCLKTPFSSSNQKKMSLQNDIPIMKIDETGDADHSRDQKL